MTLMLLMLAACGGRSADCSAGDTDWWVIEGCGAALDSGLDDEDGEDEDGDGDGDDDEDDGGEDGQILWVELTLNGREVTGGVVGYYEGSGGSTICDAENEVGSASTSGGCGACELAWTLTLNEGWSEGEGCASAGWPREAGDTYGVGYAGTTAYINDGSGWTEAGEVEQTGGGLEIFVGATDD